MKKKGRSYTKEADALSNKYCNKTTISNKEEDPETVLLISFEASVSKLHDALEKAAHSFQGITHSKGFRAGMYNEAMFEGLVKKGIECRHFVYESDKAHKLVATTH